MLNGNRYRGIIYQIGFIMKKHSILSIILLATTLASCNGNKKPEINYEDTFTPGYVDELSTTDGMKMLDDALKIKLDYSELKTGSMKVVRGANMDNYKADIGVVSGNYEYENYGAFDVEQGKLHIEFNYKIDESIVSSDTKEERTVKGNTKNEVTFWMDGELGYEAYHKFSSEGMDSKVYYINEGEDALDLKDAIAFETCSEMITPQIDSWKDAKAILESGEATNIKFESDGDVGNLYGSWDYGEYHMELQSESGYMVYELIERSEKGITEYFKYRYRYDVPVKVEVPTIDETWTLEN